MRAEVQAVQYWFLWYGDKAVARGGCQMHRRGHRECSDQWRYHRSHLERVARLLWMAVASSSCVILRLCRIWRILLPTSTSILDIDFPPGKDGKQKLSYREVYWIWMRMSISI